MHNNHIEFFTNLLTQKHVLTTQDSTQPYTEEPRKKYHATTRCVLRPKNTEQVSKVMQYAHKHNLPIIPQGGNTGLVGGQVPKLGTEIILSLSRLSNTIEISKSNQSLTCGAGTTLQQVQQAADDENLFFPLSLASEGSCQIGGNIATNAGGTGVLKYGNMRDLVLGLEVVMANGEIWSGLKSLRKDNTGYDLKHLFIGSEGTLGIITKACLKLYAKPKNIATAFCAINSPQDAVDLLTLSQQNSNNQVITFEIIPQIGIDFVLKHGDNPRFPLTEKTPWYILLETTGSDEQLTNILEQAFEKSLIQDATIAQNKTQAKEFWYLRHMLSEVQSLEGGSIKHDISVPITDIPSFLIKAKKIVEATIPNARPVPFGHIGDGNLHYNISQPKDMDKQEFLSHWQTLADKIHALVLDFNGSISAEHGIGQMKYEDMKKIKSSLELALMQKIKQSLDPKNLLNPEKTVPLEL